MATVKDLLGQRPTFHMQSLNLDAIDPKKIWANYDQEADSVVIYITGKPQPAVSVYSGDNIYVMVDPATRAVVGFHVEKWERKFVPAHADIASVWTMIKNALSTEQNWRCLLQMLALWTIFTLKANNGATPVLQPA
jgi:hypothetical protein